MNSIEIKKGDKFIYKSKYGGVIRGEIADFNLIHSIEKEGLIYKWKIKSTNGIWYKFSEVKICKEFYTEEEYENITKTFEMLSKRKQDFKEIVKNKGKK